MGRRKRGYHRISKDQVEKIMELYATGSLSNGEIAAKCGISRSSVNKFVSLEKAKKRQANGPGGTYDEVVRNIHNGRPRIEEPIREYVLEQHKAGIHKKDIAESTGISQVSVYNILSEYRWRGML